ncbi:M23 family metallopeptidase [Mycobacterium sp. NPDC050853]|uniref:M23 family metallopeptidase n=1 Tax=Mycobacterium sp. NPDC050853 TaxID=3155160 RepID=UPI00340D6D3D
MTQHRTTRTRGDRSAAPSANEITNIVPIDEFGLSDALERPDLEDYDVYEDAPLESTEPENKAALDQIEHDWVQDTDEADRIRASIEATADWFAASAARTRDPRDTPTDKLPRISSGGAHRRREIGQVGKTRIALAAMAAGAAAAAGYTALSEHDAATTADRHSLALGNSAAVMATHGPQLISAPLATDTSITDEQLAKATAFASERADREKRLLAPRFVMPANGTFTSGFGYRWGALHGGIDIANSIGTPIVAAADGVVIATGPTAGYGAWVKIRHSDGTVTLYGHINTWEVAVGERVMAGDRIATIGNRGNSTGPHLHFEVLLGGSQRIDPQGWLANKGITFSRFGD